MLPSQQQQQQQPWQDIPPTNTEPQWNIPPYIPTTNYSQSLPSCQYASTSTSSNYYNQPMHPIQHTVTSSFIPNESTVSNSNDPWNSHQLCYREVASNDFNSHEQSISPRTVSSSQSPPASERVRKRGRLTPEQRAINKRESNRKSQQKSRAIKQTQLELMQQELTAVKREAEKLRMENHQLREAIRQNAQSSREEKQFVNYYPAEQAPTEEFDHFHIDRF